MRSYLLVLLFLSTVINYVDRQALSVVLPVLRKELGLSSTDYGNITSVFMIAYTIGQVALGNWIDKVGTRVGFAISILAWSLAAIGHAFVATGMQLLGLRFVLGLGESGNWPAGAKAVAETLPPERRAFGMAIFDGGSAVGAILAPPLVALLATQYGWRAAFALTGTVGLIWLVVWWFSYRPLIAAPEKANRVWWGMLRVRALWGLMVTRFLATPVWWFYVFWLPDYLSKGRGFTLEEIGLFGWIPYLTVDIGKMIGGAASDRMLRIGRTATFARKSVMAVGALAMMGGLMVAGAPSASQALVWVSVATFGFGLWSANILALHADCFSSASLATAIGWTGTAASLSGAAFTWAVGRMVDQMGYAPAFTAAGSLAIFALGSLVFLVGKVERQA
jgi:ACS family hexuronate transporter-like MFS transporter